MSEEKTSTRCIVCKTEIKPRLIGKNADMPVTPKHKTPDGHHCVNGAKVIVICGHCKKEYEAEKKSDLDKCLECKKSLGISRHLCSIVYRSLDDDPGNDNY